MAKLKPLQHSSLHVHAPELRAQHGAQPAVGIVVIHTNRDNALERSRNSATNVSWHSALCVRVCEPMRCDCVVVSHIHSLTPSQLFLCIA